MVRALLPKAYFACVYAKPAGRGLADDVLKEVSQDTWIVLPWEQIDAHRSAGSRSKPHASREVS